MVAEMVLIFVLASCAFCGFILLHFIGRQSAPRILASPSLIESIANGVIDAAMHDGAINKPIYANPSTSRSHGPLPTPEPEEESRSLHHPDPAWEGWLMLPEIASPFFLDEMEYQVNSLGQLPSNKFPALCEIEREESSVQDIAGYIEMDWELSRRLLKLANSAFYAFDEKVTDIRRAIILLGLDSVHSLIYLNAIFSGLEDLRGVIDTRMLFDHSLAASRAARYFARDMNPHKQAMVMTAGLFHDLGKLCCARISKVKTEAAFADVKDGTSFDTAQLKRFGVSHYLITKMLLDRWHFPSILTDLIIELAPGPPRMTNAGRALQKGSLFASHIGYDACGTEGDISTFPFGLNKDEERLLVEDIRSRVGIFSRA